MLFTFISSKQGVTALSGKYLTRISLIACKCTNNILYPQIKFANLLIFSTFAVFVWRKEKMQFKSYLKFLLKSTNEHGVHSPFVYNFVTRCLYNKQLVNRQEIKGFPPTLSKRQLVLLLKIIRYLEVKTIFTDEDMLNSITAIKETCNISFQLQPSVTYDLLFINYPKEDLSIYLNYMHNDSILIINNIYQKEKASLWQALTANERITVYIDVYSQGYIFIRREQGKEGFYIR